jgi:hypothetical protein
VAAEAWAGSAEIHAADIGTAHGAKIEIGRGAGKAVMERARWFRGASDG